MPIRYRCPRCQQLLSIATRRAGADVPCPRCGTTTVVPQPEAESADAGDHSEGFAAGPELSLPPAAAIAPMAEASGRSSPRLRRPEASEAASVGSAAHEEADDDDDVPIQIRRKKRGEDELDMTPMVDMTFLLLIFFMVTASFGLQKTLQIPPPDDDKKGAAQSFEQNDDIQAQSIRIEVDGANLVSVEEAPLADVAALAEAIRERMRTELKTEAMVTIDPRALHETAVRVVDACNEAGIQKIRLVGKAVAGVGD